MRAKCLAHLILYFFIPVIFVSSANPEVPHYVNFSIIVLVSPSEVQISSTLSDYTILIFVFKVVLFYIDPSVIRIYVWFGQFWVKRSPVFPVEIIITVYYCYYYSYHYHRHHHMPLDTAFPLSIPISTE